MQILQSRLGSLTQTINSFIALAPPKTQQFPHPHKLSHHASPPTQEPTTFSFKPSTTLVSLTVNPPPKLCSLLAPPLVILPSVTPVSNAQLPMSSFLAGPVGEMSKSKMSIGRPRVVHALGRIRTFVLKAVKGSTHFGISTIPAT